MWAPLRSAVRVVFRRRRVERELDDELRFHLEMQAAENVRRGMDAVRARQAAVQSFGGYERVKEQCRDARGARSVEMLAQDTRFALRALRTNPGFAAAAVLTLGLGIGANTALFSVVDAVLLRPLPYAEPERLVQIWSSSPHGIARNSMSPADFFDLRDEAVAGGVLESMGGYVDGDAFTLTGRGEPTRVTGAMVTTGLFDVLGVQAASGRTFVQADGDGDALVVVLSDVLWRTRFGASPAVIGESVTLDARAYTIAGVMPPGFAFPSAEAQLWVPLAGSWRSASRSAHFLGVVGRLAREVRPDAALAFLRDAALRLEAAYPASNKGWGVTLVPLHESVTGGARRALLVLLAAVGCVLLIACANVATLLLARGTVRIRELAVRAALGATRARVARQQLTESAVIGVLGGAAGILIAYWSLLALRGAGGFQLPRFDEVRLDARLLAVATAAAVLTGLAAGLVPAWRVARTDPIEALRGGRAAAPGGARLRALLVAAEIALTLALMIGAGLLVRSMAQLGQVDTGLRADGVLLAEIGLPTAVYPPAARAAFFDAAVDEIRTIPGVEAAGAGGPIPLSGREAILRFGLRIEGRPDAAAGRGDRVYVRWATEGYFRAMGIPVLAGRAFSDRDRGGSTPVAVIDETLAARHFPGESPLGRRIRASNDQTWREIVGVVGAVRQTRIEDAPEPHMYVLQAQRPTAALTIAVRTAANPTALLPAVRERVRRLDPDLAVFNARTLQDVVSGSVASRRFSALALALFAALAAVLTSVGIYGVMAYWVSESTQEIGVRLALGATRGGILGMVLGRSLRVTAAGMAAGLGLAAAGSGALSGLLFGVTATDPPTFAAVSLLVVTVAAAASYVPARRALAIDAATSLRSD